MRRNQRSGTEARSAPRGCPCRGAGVPGARSGVPLILLASALVVGCKPGSGEPQGEPPATEIQLEGEILSDSTAIGQPLAIRWSAGRLWVADAVHDPALHLFDATSGALLLSAGRRGDGPGEFRSVPHLHVQPGDSSGSIWGWDVGAGRLTRILADPQPGRSSVVRIEPSQAETVVGGVRFPWRLIWLDENRLVGVNASEEARFSFITAEGVVAGTAAGRLLGDESIPLARRNQATMSGFLTCAWPGQGFAILFKSTGRIELYDEEARFVQLADVPFPSDAFMIDANGDPAVDYSGAHYQSCAVSGNRLFAGYSGARYEDFESGDPASYAVRRIHVFGWDGRLETVYDLDRDVFAIDVTPDGSTLFATSLVSSSVYRFPLPGAQGPR